MSKISRTEKDWNMEQYRLQPTHYMNSYQMQQADVE